MNKYVSCLTDCWENEQRRKKGYGVEFKKERIMSGVKIIKKEMEKGKRGRIKEWS